VAVFCDGDFWHGREWERLKEELARRHNATYWLEKIGRNRERDVETTAMLELQGWLVVRIWESEIRKNPREGARRILKAVAERKGSATRMPIKSQAP
jgi:DNA mismatch endonuclease (patch repair protein)